MNLFETLKNIRRTIHKNPELSNKEFKTANLVEKYLNNLGIKTYRLCKTGVVGILEGAKNNSNNKKTIALRADLDALPIQEENNHSYKSQNDGIMHACGHDGNTTMLLGAAMILAKQTKEFSGKVIIGIVNPNPLFIDKDEDGCDSDTAQTVLYARYEESTCSTPDIANIDIHNKDSI